MRNLKNNTLNWMKNNWKKVAGVGLTALSLGGICVYAFMNSIEEEDLDLKTYEELDDLYEKRRHEWMKNGWNGNGEITPEMKRISNVMSKKSLERWNNNPRRVSDPNYRWTDCNRWDND